MTQMAYTLFVVHKNVNDGGYQDDMYKDAKAAAQQIEEIMKNPNVVSVIVGRKLV